MFNVNFKTSVGTAHGRKNKAFDLVKTQTQPIKPQKTIPFKGGIDFILVNKCAQKLPINSEFKHIEDILKTLGVKELELGDNIELARLIKSAMCRLKRIGFDIPTKIKCSSKYFDNDPRIQQELKVLKSKSPFNAKVTIPGYADWDGISEPVLYFNPNHNWHKGNGDWSKINDQRHAIWHETGHYLHMKNYKNNPYAFKTLTMTHLNDYQKEIFEKCIGKYSVDGPIAEAVAETFSKLVSGESYNSLHPEIFHVYTKYNGPMPKIKK